MARTISLSPSFALGPPLAPPSPEAWAATAFLGLFCSALGYLLWNAAIPALGVTVTNNLIYGIPLVGVLAGVWFLWEPLTARVVACGALVIGGVALASRSATPRTKRGLRTAQVRIDTADT